MGITPTTKAQVSGHKFLARRIEHGLVFGDIRMIHDPLAKRRRALGFGLAACVLIALGAVVLGIFRPAVDPGSAGIIKADTGQLYVRLEDRLHPVPNLVSARLIVGEPIQAKSASAAVIGDIPKAAPIGIGDAPTFMPELGEKQPPVTAHACHSVPTLTSRLDIAQAQLTVVFHPETAADAYIPLKTDAAILAEVNNAEWVIRATGRSVLPPPNTETGRAIRRRLGIGPLTPRWQAPPQLVSGIHEDPAITVPREITEILKVTGAQQPTYWAKQESGIMPATPLQADILIDSGVPLRVVPGTALGELPDSPHLPPRLPAQLPLPESEITWIDPVGNHICLTDAGGVDMVQPAPDGKQKPTFVGDAIQLSGDTTATHFAGTGWAIGIDTGNGVHVVSAHGRRHQLETPETAPIIGIDTIHKTSWDIVRLLPAGTPLSKEQALRTMY